jgi:hypothetical protein
MAKKPLAEIREEVVDALTRLEDIAATAPPRKPYSGGHSSDLPRRNNPTEFTKPTTKLCIELDRLKVPYLGEKYVPVDKWVCRGGNGKCREKFYRYFEPAPDARYTCGNGHFGSWERVQLKCDTLVHPLLLKDRLVDGALVQMLYISVEAEGGGTASASEERDRLLAEQGILVWHVPNPVLKDYAWCVAALFALLVK